VRSTNIGPVTTFRNEHELLVYLVRLDESENKWRMSPGQTLVALLREDGHFDPAHQRREYAELGQMLQRLKDDEQITFIDTVGRNLPNGRPDPYYASFTRDDVNKFDGIQVRAQGRAAVNANQPSVIVNIESLDILTVLALMERDVDRTALDDEQKAQAKTKIRTAMDALGDVSKATLAETLAAALRQMGHLP
jgi:hypothetical protein